MKRLSLIPGIQLEYENVVNARGSPAVHVDAHQKEEENQEQGATVQTNHNIELLSKLQQIYLFIINKRENIGMLIGIAHGFQISPPPSLFAVTNTM